ncbi:MAG: hypothetical protein ACYDGU_13665 [Acidiferrobacterales bacterium]
MARRASGAAGQPQDLMRMRQRLDEWRGSHARGVAFPDALWSAAGRVAQRRGVYVTARALGLEYNKLKRASGGLVAQGRDEARRPPKAKPMKFIEVTGVLPASPGGCRLSLQGPEGQRLQLEMAPGAAAEMVLQLCRSGWGTL